jgi:hypothetical protein
MYKLSLSGCKLDSNILGHCPLVGCDVSVIEPWIPITRVTVAIVS